MQGDGHIALHLHLAGQKGGHRVQITHKKLFQVLAGNGDGAIRLHILNRNLAPVDDEKAMLAAIKFQHPVKIGSRYTIPHFLGDFTFFNHRSGTLASRSIGGEDEARERKLQIGIHAGEGDIMAIRAAVFDVFGTVVDWRSGVAGEMAGRLRDKGLDHDAGAFADAWRAEYQPAMERIRSGARGYVPLDDLHRENLDRALKATGLETHFDKAERDALNLAWERLPPWADSVAGVAAIRGRVPVATCSNGSIALMVALSRFAGLCWDAILGAEIAQGYKPDPKVYLAAAAALRLEPGEVLMVAAHNSDLDAARAAGLKTAFIPRPDEKGPGLGESRATGAWDIIADDLVDLAEKI